MLQMHFVIANEMSSYNLIEKVSQLEYFILIVWHRNSIRSGQLLFAYSISNWRNVLKNFENLILFCFSVRLQNIIQYSSGNSTFHTKRLRDTGKKKTSNNEKLIHHTIHQRLFFLFILEKYLCFCNRLRLSVSGSNCLNMNILYGIWPMSKCVCAFFDGKFAGELKHAKDRDYFLVLL